MKLLIIIVVFLFSMSIYGSGELDFSSYYLAGNDSAANGDRSTPSVETISEGQYITGGVIGTVFGFGIGHAVQGRWTKTGWIHTTLQVGGVVVVTASYLWALPLMFTPDEKGTVTVMGIILLTTIVTGGVAFWGSKIWEIVDVWRVPSSMKVVSKKRLYMAPTLYSQNNQGHFLGMKLQYSF